MNKEIKELYRSCRSKEALSSQDQYNSADVLIGSEVEKFAELLVAECCKRIRNELKPDSNYHTDWDRGMKYSISLIENIVKE